MRYPEWNEDDRETAAILLRTGSVHFVTRENADSFACAFEERYGRLTAVCRSVDRRTHAVHLLGLCDEDEE